MVVWYEGEEDFTTRNSVVQKDTTKIIRQDCVELKERFYELSSRIEKATRMIRYKNQ